MNYWYRAYGLTLQSEIACPELPEIDATTSPDVVIRLVQSIASTTGSNETHFSEIADVALFRIEKGREILVHPTVGARAEDVRQYLYGVGLTAILYQRDESPIHAGAVAWGGQAHLFCGESGAGKSTLMTQLRRRGVHVLCDDVGVIRQGSDAIVRFYHGVPRVKLWRDALTHFGIGTAALQRDLTRLDKFHVPLDVVAFDALPLGSVFNLQPRRDVDPPAIVALSSRETLEMLLRNTYRPRLLRRLGNPGHHMMRLVAAAGQASGFEFHRPWNLDRLDACGDTLVSHLATTIPTGAAA
ncbi:MAG: hypothetical protein V4472_03195 [Pseudomonadota bacterium]